MEAIAGAMVGAVSEKIVTAIDSTVDDTLDRVKDKMFGTAKKRKMGGSSEAEDEDADVIMQSPEETGPTAPNPGVPDGGNGDGMQPGGNPGGSNLALLQKIPPAVAFTIPNVMRKFRKVNHFYIPLSQYNDSTPKISGYPNGNIGIMTADDGWYQIPWKSSAMYLDFREANFLLTNTVKYRYYKLKVILRPIY